MRGIGVGRVIVALAVILSTTVPAAQGEAQGSDAGIPPLVHSVSPRPGEVLAAGAVAVALRVRSSEPLRSALLSVDGGPAEVLALGERNPAGEVAVGSAILLAPGDHVLRMQVEDAGGRRAERAWSVSATDRATARLAGDTRFDTAVDVSEIAFPLAGSASAAVVARADEFADALAGVPLAAAVRGPLLLSGGDRLAPTTAQELRRVLEPGSSVHLLGGEAVLGSGVAREIEGLGLRVVRHAGADRFATAAAVAQALPPADGVIVASATSFPDALAASAPAARDGLPVLLTASDDLPESTTAALVEREVAVVTIVGGTAAVGADVERRLAGVAGRVQRVAGEDRYATAAAVLDAFYDQPVAVSLTSGTAFPDALAGAVRSGSLGQPLLLTPPAELSPATAQALRAHRPDEITVYGGAGAVAEHVVSAALRAALDGSQAPRVVTTSPALPALEAVTVALDRPVDPSRSSVYLEVGGTEVPAVISETGPTTTLTARAAEAPSVPPGSTSAGRVVVAASGIAGGVAHDDIAFTYLAPDPVFAMVGEVALHLPSTQVEMIGFHQSGHDGAREMNVRDTATPTTTLPSRGRGTGLRTAADVVAAPGVEVLAPVTGRVLLAGSYTLYCDHTDSFAVIEPDARPGWEVKVLHFEGLQVRPGDRVVASATVLGSGPRALPFRSQVDDFSRNGWPHVHVEVVDPSIPDRPGSGC